MLARLGATARIWAVNADPRSNVIGVARSLLAASALGTLLFTPRTKLLAYAPDGISLLHCQHHGVPNVFCIVPQQPPVLGVIVAILVLTLCLIGWRPRIMSVLHWWVAYSFFAASPLVDGGDQITMVLTFALMLVCAADDRRWHWTTPPEITTWSVRRVCERLAVLSVIIAVRLQVAGVYLEAAIAKTRVTEWRDGTATYYWFHDPEFGMSGWRALIALPLLERGAFVAACTWGAMLLEFLLFAGLLMEKRYRRPLLMAGILFHTGIALAHGLVSFAVAMFAALILYLRPVDAPFALRLPEWLKVAKLEIKAVRIARRRLRQA